MTDIEAQLLASFGVPPALVGPARPSESHCDCGGCHTPQRSLIADLWDEMLLLDPHWPEDWIPWQALAGLLVVFAVWLWNRGAR